MKKDKLIIFDLDGTLYKMKGGSFANSKLREKVLRNAVKYIKIKLKISKHEAEIILEEIVSEYGENISIALEKKYKLNRYEYFDYVWNINPSPYIKKSKDVEGSLIRLNKDYEFLLMSDSPKIWISNVLKVLGIESFFKGKILSGEGNKRKIFGNRYDDILSKYNIIPSNVIVVGDQENTDIAPAKKIGLNTIFINQSKKSKFADANIRSISNLEPAISYLYNGFSKNKYYVFALNNIKIKELYRVKVLKGSSNSIILRYKNSIFKSGLAKNITKEIQAYEKFKNILGSEYNKIFPHYAIVKQTNNYLVYKIKLLGEYSLEDYLLSPKSKNEELIQSFNDSVLKNLKTIYAITKSDNTKVMEDFYKEIIGALYKNLLEANLLNKNNLSLLKLLESNESIFIKNCLSSMAHKDLTVGNIVVNLKNNSSYFIDPRVSVPYSNEKEKYGNIAIDLIGYYISVLRKDMEIKKNSNHISLMSIKKRITSEITYYIGENVTSQPFVDLCNLFWYSVYLACKCDFCLSPERKWLYDEMKNNFDLYFKKIIGYIKNNNQKTLDKESIVNHVVMIDLDGVVLNEEYQTTKDISENVKKAAKKLLLVPNSDTPIPRLERFFIDAFGLKWEVIIGELGSTLKYYNSLIRVCQISGIDYFVSQIKNKFESIGARVYLGDSTTWVRKGKYFQPNCNLVLIDAFRTQSVGMFFLKTTIKGNVVIDNTWSSQCLDVLKKIDKPSGLAKFCYNGRYGFAGSSAKGITKTHGYLALKRIIPKAQFYMIGDSDIDIINDSNVIHLSVANGTNNLKARSGFISDYAYTAGLEDCLKWILKNI